MAVSHVCLVLLVDGSRKEILLRGRRSSCVAIGLSETGTVAGGSLGVALGTCCSLGGLLEMCGLGGATSEAGGPAMLVARVPESNANVATMGRDMLVERVPESKASVATMDFL